MFRVASYVLFSVLFISMTANAAVVSMYVPGIDPGEPIAADFLGTDGQGHTTWRISGGTPSGTYTVVPSTPVQSATLISGPKDAHISVGDKDGGLRADCSIDNDESVCTVVLSAPGTQVSQVLTETATPIDVQVAATLAPGGTPTGSSGSNPTGSPGGAPQNPNSPNGAGKRVAGSAAAVTILGGLGAVLAVFGAPF